MSYIPVFTGQELSGVFVTIVTYNVSWKLCVSPFCPSCLLVSQVLVLLLSCVSRIIFYIDGAILRCVKECI